MKKISETPCHPNDVPVIFIYDHYGEIKGKISINEWKANKEKAQLLNELEIKLYRESINYYTNNDFEKAEDLLLFLISQTDYTHYEYVERLANLYRRKKRISKERELLLKARKNITAFEASEGIIRRIDKRLEKLTGVEKKTRRSFLLQ
ncbi:hypothetical protein ACYSNO_00835 [Enterococcus sp. LJL98]